MYLTFTQLEDTSWRAIVVEVLRAIFSYALIPSGVSFLVAFVTYMIGARRYLLAVHRNDFVYITLLAVAVSRLLTGIIESFCIIVPEMYVVTSSILNLVLQTLALAVVFFFVFAKRYGMHAVEKYMSFRVWGMVYLILLGLSVVLENTAYLLAVLNADAFARVNEMLKEIYDVVLVKSDLQIAASIAALSIYVAFVVAAVIIGEVMKRKAGEFITTEVREGRLNLNVQNMPNGGASQSQDGVFEEMKSDNAQGGNDSKDDKVFDEFDI